MRTQINLYMVVFVTAIISTGLTAQDSIEEITVTSSYVTHSDDEANDPIHILTEEELETKSKGVYMYVCVVSLSLSLLLPRVLPQSLSYTRMLPLLPP